MGSGRRCPGVDRAASQETCRFRKKRLPGGVLRLVGQIEQPVCACPRAVFDIRTPEYFFNGAGSGTVWIFQRHLQAQAETRRMKQHPA